MRFHRGLLTPSAALCPAPAAPALKFLGHSTALDGSDPTPPAHVSGNLLVSGAVMNEAHSGSAPSAASPWVLPTNGSAFGGTQRAAAVYHLTATADDHTVTWTNANNPRNCWVFEDAEFDVAMAFEAANSTTVDWPALTGMAENCIVGVCIMTRGAQVDIAATVGADMIALGFTERAKRNTIPAFWIGDTNTTLLDSFDPASTTLDTTSSQHAGFVFSVKAAS